MVAPPSVSDSDLIHAALTAAVPSPDLGLAVTLGQGIVTTSSQGVGKYASVSNTGTATAPLANVAICTITPGVAGYYKIDCYVGFDGTAESTTADNFVIHIGGGIPGGIGHLMAVNAVNTISPVQTYYAALTAAQAVSIDSVAAGSAGSIYKASVICTRVA